MKQYVIIGNGVAAAGCIEGIRSADPNGAVTVVSAERHPVYCRPLISYYLEGKTDIERMRYRDAGFYEQNGCRVLYGRSAVRLDAAAKTVELDDGTILPYDSICVAAGSSPFLPPLEGLETVEKAFTFMTLDDALALEAAVKDDSRVLIVGAGLIGLKCAEGLYNRAASITVCDLAGRVLSSVLDDECAARMQRHLEAHGIRFLLGDSVRRLDGKKAYMNGGAVVDFDVLVLAVGVRGQHRARARCGRRDQPRHSGGRKHGAPPCPTSTPPATARRARTFRSADGACWRFCPTHICRGTAPAYVWRAAARRLIRRFR